MLLHTFICDENFGYISNPGQKDPEHEIFIKEINQPALVYMRDNWAQFVKYLEDNKDWIDPIIYTTGLHPYTNNIMNLIDPEKKVFNHRLY